MPIRMCLGCREREEQSKLLRVTLLDSGWIISPSKDHEAWKALRNLVEKLKESSKQEREVGGVSSSREQIKLDIIVSDQHIGRGFYLHYNQPECHRVGLQEKKVSRALRRKVSNVSLQLIEKFLADVVQ